MTVIIKSNDRDVTPLFFKLSILVIDHFYFTSHDKFLAVMFFFSQFFFGYMTVIIKSNEHHITSLFFKFPILDIKHL